MNSNFIAPEALDDASVATCLQCGWHFRTPEEKITFYQGSCPNCGLDPLMPCKGLKGRSSIMPRYYSTVNVAVLEDDMNLPDIINNKTLRT